MTLRGAFDAHSRVGFTLIEIMVVLVIISIITGVVVSEMSGGLQDALLRTSGRQLISVFSLASSRAVALNLEHRVEIDRRTGHYVIEKQNKVGQFVPADEVSGGQGVIDTRIAVRVEDLEENAEAVDEARPARTPPGAVEFFPDGTSDGRAVELRDREGFGLALRLNALTARVKILELPRQ